MIQIKFPVLLLLLMVLLCSGCNLENRQKSNLGEITQITYSSSSGSILPDLQWHEEIIITLDDVTLTRNGKTPDSLVNSGTWRCQIDPSITETLFIQMKDVDCSIINRIESKDSPDGRSVENYIIHYQSGTTCDLFYDPGTEYLNGEMIVNPILEYMKLIDFPQDSVAQYEDIP